MNTITIGSKKVGPGQPTFIIAEAGVNHNGRLDLALKLVDAAKDAGADAVKFQTFRAEQLVTHTGVMAGYQKRNTGKNESQRAMLKKLELNESFYKPLIAHCKKRNIMFLSAAHGGFESVDLLKKLHIPAIKFSSADLTNLPVIAYAAKTRVPLIISTGMGTLKEVREAVVTAKKAGNHSIIVLQCTTDYPTDPSEVNLRAMQTINNACGVVVGFSDHTEGTQAGIMAVTLGAVVIEKHLSLDKTMEGPDHAASLDPQEFAEYVRALRDAEVILGSTEKSPSKSEKQYIPIVRKSIVSRRAIQKGELFTKENLTIKRPGTGLPPLLYEKILGKKSKRAIPADELLSKRDI